MYYYNYKDTKGVSFYRVKKDGRYYYSKQVTINGKRTWTPLFSKKSDIKQYVIERNIDSFASTKTKQKKVAKVQSNTDNTKATNDITFGEIAIEFFKACKHEYHQKGKSTRHLENIDIQIRVHLSNLCVDGVRLFDINIKELSSQQIVIYKRQVNINRQNATTSTIKKTFDIFNVILKYALQQGYITNSIIVDSNFVKPQGKQSKPKEVKKNYLTTTEFQSFLDNYDEMYECDLFSNNLSKQYKYLLYRTMFIFLFYTGTRISECRGVQWKDIECVKVDDELYRVHINGQYVDTYGCEKIHGYIDTLKTKGSRRYIYLHKACVTSLQRYRDFLIDKNLYDKEHFVFANLEHSNCRPFAPATIRDKFNLVKQHMNIDIDGRCVTIHGLRHSACIFYLELGMDKQDVARILGHSNTTMIDEIYNHIVDVLELDSKKQSRILAFLQ